jgi:hypothetical protein
MASFPPRLPRTVGRGLVPGLFEASEVGQFCGRTSNFPDDDLSTWQKHAASGERETSSWKDGTELPALAASPPRRKEQPAMLLPAHAGHVPAVRRVRLDPSRY